MPLSHALKDLPSSCTDALEALLAQIRTLAKQAQRCEDFQGIEEKLHHGFKRERERGQVLRERERGQVLQSHNRTSPSVAGGRAAGAHHGREDRSKSRSARLTVL